MPINNCVCLRCKRHVIMEIFSVHIIHIYAYGFDIKCAHWIWYRMQAVNSQCTRFHPFFVWLCAYMFVLNSWIMDSRIQFNSIQLKMDNDYIQFRSRFSSSSSLWFTLALFQNRDGTYAHRVYVRLLLDLLFRIFGFCTGNIFVHKMSHQLCVRTLFIADAFGWKWAFQFFSLSLSVLWSRDGRHWLKL